VLRHRKAAGASGKFRVWVMGTVSASARKQLTQRGIEVAEDVDKRVEFMD